MKRWSLCGRLNTCLRSQSWSEQRWNLNPGDRALELGTVPVGCCCLWFRMKPLGQGRSLQLIRISSKWECWGQVFNWNFSQILWWELTKDAKLYFLKVRSLGIKAIISMGTGNLSLLLAEYLPRMPWVEGKDCEPLKVPQKRWSHSKAPCRFTSESEMWSSDARIP